MTTLRGMGSSGRSTPAVAASVAAHGPGGVHHDGGDRTSSRTVRTPATRSRSTITSTTSSPSESSRAGTSRERRVPLRETCRVGDPVVAGRTWRRPTPSSEMPGTIAAACCGVSTCASTPSDAAAPRPRGTPATVALVADEEQVSVLPHVERGSRAPRRTAGSSARSPATAGCSPRSRTETGTRPRTRPVEPGPHRVGTLQQQHPPAPAAARW